MAYRFVPRRGVAATRSTGQRAGYARRTPAPSPGPDARQRIVYELISFKDRRGGSPWDQRSPSWRRSIRDWKPRQVAEACSRQGDGSVATGQKVSLAEVEAKKEASTGRYSRSISPGSPNLQAEATAFSASWGDRDQGRLPVHLHLLLAESFWDINADGFERHPILRLAPANRKKYVSQGARVSCPRSPSKIFNTNGTRIARRITLYRA